MFFVTQLLYAAPRTMVLAIKAFQSRLPRDEATVRNAAKILSELSASREWTLAETYQKLGAALPLLVRLDLVWIESKLGRFKARYSAGTK